MMPRIKFSKEEKLERKRKQQREYYRKKKALRMGQDLTPNTPDLTISAELIQKNWVRIQRTVFSEDVQNYFVQLYQRKFMKNVSENSSTYPATERPDSLNNQKIKVESEDDIKIENHN